MMERQLISPKRFDLDKNGEKLAVEDFTSILGKSPQTHGEQYKYTGSYIDLFFSYKNSIFPMAGGTA